MASYPGYAHNEMNVLALADAFERMGEDIAEEVTYQALVAYERPPSVAQLVAVARDVRASQRPPDPFSHKAIMAAEPQDMPDEIRETLVNLYEKWSESEERDYEAETRGWHRYVESVKNGLKANVCNGSGLEPKERDGKLFCPGCGAPVPDLLVHVERKSVTG